MQRITLTVPVYQDAGATEFWLESIYLKRNHPDGPAEIRAVFRQVNGGGFVPNGKSVVCRLEGTEAQTAIIALNKADLRVNTLEERVTTRFQQEGQLGAGTISGTPD